MIFLDKRWSYRHTRKRNGAAVPSLKPRHDYIASAFSAEMQEQSAENVAALYWSLIKPPTIPQKARCFPGASSAPIEALFQRADATLAALLGQLVAFAQKVVGDDISRFRRAKSPPRAPSAKPQPCRSHRHSSCHGRTCSPKIITP